MDVFVTVTSSSMSDTHGVGQRSSSARTHTSMHSSKYSDAAGSRGGGTRGNLHSSSLLASSSKLKAPTRVDQEKMLHKCLTSNASTGGNGIRRPYGRFIASRGGVALSVWERMAPPLGRAASAELPSVPPSPPDRSLGRNVSKYNVQRRAYTSRSMDTSSKAVKSIYSFEGLDSINFSSSSVAEMPIFSRPRPELSGVTLSTSASDKPASVGSGSYRTNGRAGSENALARKTQAHSRSAAQAAQSDRTRRRKRCLYPRNFPLNEKPTFSTTPTTIEVIDAGNPESALHALAGSAE